MIATGESAHRAGWSRQYDGALIRLYRENGNPAQIARHLAASSSTVSWLWPESDADLVWRIYEYCNSEGSRLSKIAVGCENLFKRWAPRNPGGAIHPWQKLGRELLIAYLTRDKALRVCCNVERSQVWIERENFDDYRLKCPQCGSVLLVHNGIRI
jgi:hypothetical protein